MKLFTLLASVLVLSACARSDFDQFKSDFMDGCEKTGGTDYVCNCTFDKVEKEYGKEKIEHYQKTQNPPMSLLEFSTQSRLECMQ